VRKLFGRSIALMLLAFAATAGAQEDTHGTFLRELHRRFPATEDAVVVEAMPGYHAVIRNGQVVYVSNDFAYLIQGNATDLRTNTSLTAVLTAKYPKRVDLTKLNTRDAVRLGQGSRTLYVFSDPECPYCRQLQPELLKLHDVAIYVFPYPLDALHPKAVEVASTIWCQSDRATAWNDYVLRHVSLPASDCATPIARNLALGQTLGIKGTPALVFADGSVVEGFEMAERIEAQLSNVGAVR